MIDTPILLLVGAAMLVSAIAGLSRGRRRDDLEDERRTKELTAKLEAAAREVDEHIAARLARERKRGGRRGW